MEKWIKARLYDTGRSFGSIHSIRGTLQFLRGGGDG